MRQYRIVREIGRGSYGQVYLAEARGEERQVAIKMIVGAFRNVTDAKRTYREVHFLRELRHPCIIRLLKV